MRERASKTDPVAELRQGLRSLCDTAIRVQRSRSKGLAGYVEITGVTKNGGYFTSAEGTALDSVGLPHSKYLAVVSPDRLPDVLLAVKGKCKEVGVKIGPAPKRGRPR
jgi:hypothetical protein